jgi:hypothetical protein
MKKLRLIAALSFLPFALITTLACSDDDSDDADPTVAVPAPAQATALASDTESSVVLLGGRTLQFFPNTCSIDGNAFTVSGQGTSGAQPFSVEVSGNTSPPSADITVEIGAADAAAAQREIWEEVAAPSRVEIVGDEMRIELETEVIETTAPVDQDQAVEAQLTAACT